MPGLTCHASQMTTSMRLICLSLLMLGMVGGDLSPPDRAYKILMLLPAASKSHKNVFMPLAEALADRGHKIVILSGLDKPSKHLNIYEVNHGLHYLETDNMNMFEERTKPAGGLGLFKIALTRLAKEMYNIPKVKEIYDKRKEFDLIVFDHMFNEVAYPFAHEIPFITLATPGMDPRQSAVLGNVLNPAYVPNIIGTYDLTTACGRLVNLIANILFSFYWRHWEIVPNIQKEISAQFPDLPPLLDIERNMSLALLNSHFSMSQTVPLLPSQIEVGAMHCRPGQPLPQDIQSFIDGAGSAGVVYFSLGSVAKGETMPVKYRDMFVEAFRRMDQRILWKYETKLESVSENVMISNWLPQQDILANPNVKVFITHSGLLSTQESSYHGTPMLAIPIYADQPKNANNIVLSGLGLSLVWEELTEEKIFESLQELINNPKYQETAKTVSKLSRDQMEPPVDRAVFWTEYVIRHNGAPKLRCQGANLSWVEFLLLDVIAMIIVAIIIIFIMIRWTIRNILQLIFGKSGKKKLE